MSQDVLNLILKTIDALDEVVLGRSEVASWPASTLEDLVRQGILEEIEPAQTVVCPGCEEACIEDVEFIHGNCPEDTRAYVVCRQRDDIGRVPIPLDDLRQWKANVAGLSTVLAEALFVAGSIEVIVEGRLYLLGKLSIGGMAREVFLAVGLSRTDGERVLEQSARFQASSEPLVLVPATIPPQTRPNDEPLFVRAVKDIASVTDTGLTIDLSALVEGAPGTRRKATVLHATFPTPAGIILPKNWALG